MACPTTSTVIGSVEMSGFFTSRSGMSGVSKDSCTGLFDNTVSNHSFHLFSFSLKLVIILQSVSLVGYLTICKRFHFFTQKLKKQQNSKSDQ